MVLEIRRPEAARSDVIAPANLEDQHRLGRQQVRTRSVVVPREIRLPSNERGEHGTGGEGMDSQLERGSGTKLPARENLTLTPSIAATGEAKTPLPAPDLVAERENAALGGGGQQPVPAACDSCAEGGTAFGLRATSIPSGPGDGSSARGSRGRPRERSRTRCRRAWRSPPGLPRARELS